MLEIVICDDVELQNCFVAHVINNVIAKYGFPAKISLVTQYSEDIRQLLLSALPALRLYILDINLNGNIEGIELAKEIRRYDQASYIVYITAHLEYSLIGYKTKTFDFLIKPLHAEMLEAMLCNVFHDIRSSSVKFQGLRIRSGSTEHKIAYKQIIYLEKMRNILYVHTVDNVISSYDSLKHLTLPETFIMTHKSFIVSADHVRAVHYAKGHITLSNGEMCPLSRSHKAKFRKAWEYIHG